MSPTTYHFLPWVRDLPWPASLDKTVSLAPETTTGRLTATLTLEVAGKREAQAPVTQAPVTVALLGPRDVSGFNADRYITRRYPLGVTVETTAFPLVEFRVPSLPWLFSPDPPTGSGAAVRPWLVLITVDQASGVTINRDIRTGRPTISIPGATADAQLPDLTEAAHWAHVQLLDDLPTSNPPGDLDDTDLRRLLGDEHTALARLLCPRRLRPDTTYQVALVPSYRASLVAAGLLADTDSSGGLAWDVSSANGGITLPVYDHWTFTTGPAGDFRSLALALQPASQQEQNQLGRQDLDLTDLAAADPTHNCPTSCAGMGALQPIGTTWPDLPADTAKPLQALLNPAAAPGGLPRLTLPRYGSGPRGADTLPDDETDWFAQVNLDVRLRAAAGLGARLVGEQQERFMAAAWNQIGAQRDATRIKHDHRQGRTLTTPIWESRFRPLAGDADSPQDPWLPRLGSCLRIPAPDSASGVLQASPQLAAGALQPAYRRLSRPRGPLARRDTRRDTRRGGGASADRLALQRLSGEQQPLVPLQALHPATVLAGMTSARISQPAEPADQWHKPRLRTSTVDPDAPPRIVPTLGTPTADDLVDICREFLLPGIASLPANRVALLEPNQRFIEAFLVGVNHEFLRELLWRDFPADPTGTFFQVFWPRHGSTSTDPDTVDIPPIADWSGPMGSRPGPHPGTVALAVRSELLRRYPETHVYAAPATAPAAGESRHQVDPDPTLHRAPCLRGRLGDDTVYLGFDDLQSDAAAGAATTGGDLRSRDAEHHPGWFFVFEQAPDQPRFGLDEAATPAKEPADRKLALDGDELSWGHLADTKDQLDALTHAPVAAARPAREHWRLTRDGTALTWDGGAADVALATLRPPFRVDIHADLLVPPA